MISRPQLAARRVSRAIYFQQRAQAVAEAAAETVSRPRRQHAMFLELRFLARDWQHAGFLELRFLARIDKQHAGFLELHHTVSRCSLEGVLIVSRCSLRPAASP